MLISFDCFVTDILHVWTHLRVTSLSVSEKVNRKSLFFFWEAEMLCYLGKMGQDIIAKVVNESRVIVNAVL